MRNLRSWSKWVSMTQAREVPSVDIKFRLLIKKTKGKTSMVMFSEMVLISCRSRESGGELEYECEMVSGSFDSRRASKASLREMEFI